VVIIKAKSILENLRDIGTKDLELLNSQLAVKVNKSPHTGLLDRTPKLMCTPCQGQ